MRIEILDETGAVINTINAGTDAAQQLYPGAWRIAAEQPAPLEGAAAPRHITVGAFFDRFGPLKLAILRDPADDCRAVVLDASVRKYIDLDNPELPAGLAILQAAGHPVNTAAILDAPIQPHELP